MSHPIKLGCACGASFEMASNTYINGGGARDDKGRVFISELRAAEWLELHRQCITADRDGAEAEKAADEIEILRRALAGIVSHWDEFSNLMVAKKDDYGLDERINAARKILDRA